MMTIEGNSSSLLEIPSEVVYRHANSIAIEESYSR